MTINRSPEVVWAAVSDYSLDVLWRPDITEMRLIRLGRLQLGRGFMRYFERVVVTT